MLMRIALGALFLLAGVDLSPAQNAFPTPGGATVPGYVTMCISGNLAVPCNPGGGGGGLTAGAAVTGCPAGALLFNTSTNTLGCQSTFTENNSGTQMGVIAGTAVVPSIFSGNDGIYFGSIFGVLVAATSVMTIDLNNGVRIGTGGGGTATNSYGFVNGAANANVADTRISRNAAGVMQVGTTANNAAGNLLASGYGPGTIYVTGTIPACAAGTNGWTVVASDITTATYRTPYVGGGANTGRLFCVSGTGWLAD